MKDPAFLFYSSDFITGTYFLTDDQVGKYIRLLCMQHQKGHLTESDMINICKSYDEQVFSKFKQDGENLFFNERLQEEIDKRKAYSESRSANRKGHSKHKKHMKNISQSYVEHMGNENEDINRIKNVFVIPTIEEIKLYLKENNINSVDGDKFFNFYQAKGWMVGKNKMKDWKAAIRTWIKKDEPQKPILCR